MYEITVESDFSSAHQLRGYQGKCENLHGHNWKVQAVIASDTLNDIDLVMDFKDFRKALKTVLDELDHKNLNDLAFFMEKNPSSELLAAHIYTELRKLLPCSPVRVSVWESDRCFATYYE